MAQSKLRHTQPELNRKCVIALSILVVCLDSLDRCSSSQIATAPVGTQFYEATHPLDNHHRGALKDFLWQMDPIMFLPFKEYMSLSSTCDAYSCSKKYQVCKWHLHALFGYPSHQCLLFFQWMNLRISDRNPQIQELFICNNFYSSINFTQVYWSFLLRNTSW